MRDLVLSLSSNDVCTVCAIDRNLFCSIDFNSASSSDVSILFICLILFIIYIEILLFFLIFSNLYSRQAAEVILGLQDSRYFSEIVNVLMIPGRAEHRIACESAGLLKIELFALKLYVVGLFIVIGGRLTFCSKED